MSGVEHHVVQRGIAVCTPIPFEVKGDGQKRHANISVAWHRHRMGMGIPTNISTVELVADGMEVGDARNEAVRAVFLLARTPEFLFFLDYDVLVSNDALVKLLSRARRFPDIDIYAGIYCSKSPGLPEPLMYKHDGDGPFWDWAVGDLVFDLESVHMGCTLIRTSLFKKLGYDDLDKPLFKSFNEQIANTDGTMSTNRGTEDIYFCQRAREEADAEIMVDTSILCGHQDIGSGVTYGMFRESWPIQRAKWFRRLKGETIENEDDRLVAIDLGAGGQKREWDGYVTESTDIRPGIDTDYVQDTTALNFPTGSYDMVASSHHLEHLGRFDQEKVWEEMFRILKPGGKMEHIVPNIQWAAEHVVDGKMDEHIMNVFYGAQEYHGYKREYNTHFFGYTPEVARELAEGCGLINVEVKTYKENPELGYNMIITGEKPIEGVQVGDRVDLRMAE